MRKIINKKVYDTVTAKPIGAWSNSCNAGDFNLVIETLYRKKTGEYFLHGEGGANTRYSVQDYGGWSGGEAITPLTPEQARDWAEEHLDAAEYELEFGTPAEDDSHHVMTITVAEGTYRAIRAMATERDCMMGDVVDAVIAAYRGNTTACR